jgi:hypothetical protein
MANARTQFDAIAGYLERVHEARAELLYGKPSLTLNGHAFAAYATDAMAFRLHGRALALAQGLPGARGWDPLRGQGSSPGWVLIPASQVMRWNRLALDALRCAREAAERRVSYAVPQVPVQVEAPPPSTPTSLAQRFAAAVAAGFKSFSVGRAE